MPRPKGSKNKTTIEREQPKEFDYERDDVLYDNSYQQVVDTSNQQPVESWTLESSPPMSSFATDTLPFDRIVPTETLYLVEGEVQMQPREPGRGSMVAKQFRIVSASSEEQAVGKFSEYFRSLSDSSSVYTVLRAAAMETIY